MRFDDLFDQRILVGNKLKDYMRSNGFSKVALSQKAGISRPTLDRILNGRIDSKSTFDKHMKKILAALQLDAERLLFYETPPKAVEAVYSQNAPGDHQMNDVAQKQYGLLMDVLNLCSIYY